MDDEIKLGRVGHYQSEVGGECWSASITKVHPKQFDSDAGGELPRQINVAGWDPEGNAFSRRGVSFTSGEGWTSSATGSATFFHLNRDCPEAR